MNEFEEMDIVVEIGEDVKWIVWSVDSYSYHLRSCLWGDDRPRRHRVDKDGANSRFVKVGKWDWIGNKEIMEG